MQSIIALQARPSVQCTTWIRHRGSQPCLRIEICTTGLYTCTVLTMYDLAETYHAQETTLSVEDYVNDRPKVSTVPEIRIGCSCAFYGLGIGKHTRGFSLQTSHKLGDVYYTAEMMRTILRALIDACAEWWQVACALRQALAWVDAHK